jgi:hypothetical protein
MGYQIYGYVQIKNAEGWITAPIYHKSNYEGMEPVILWHGREVGRYLWQKGTYVTRTEAEEFMDKMHYDREEGDALEPVKAISLAYMKYLALTFDPDHNDYDDSGDEDCIKPGLEDMVRKIDTIVEFADFYGNLDEVRFIFHESY